MNGEHHHPKSRNTGVTVAATASGASATVLYTCPPKNKGEVHILSVSNPSSTLTISVTVEVYNSQASSYYSIVNSSNLEPNSNLFVISSGDNLYLNPSDKIVVSASTASTLTSFIGVRETYGEALA